MHEKQQAIVKFVEGVPDTVAALKANFDEVTGWLASSNLEGFGNRLAQIEVSHKELESGVDRWFGEIRAAAAAAGSVGAGGFTGANFQGGPFAERDRNVFDPRDYKLAEFGTKPTMARWKKWRRDL